MRPDRSQPGPLPDDRVIWNSWGSDIVILEDGDLVQCGLFDVKRYGLEPPR